MELVQKTIEGTATEAERQFLLDRLAINAAADFLQPKLPFVVTKGLLKYSEFLARFARECERSGPPKWGQFVLYLSLPKKTLIPLLGDLEERFMTELVPKFGHRAATFWYWNEVCKYVVPGAIDRVEHVIEFAFKMLRPKLPS